MLEPWLTVHTALIAHKEGDSGFNQTPTSRYVILSSETPDPEAEML